MKHKCPACHKLFDKAMTDKARDSNSFPFCSAKCKLIDLGAWFDSEYKIFSELQLQDGDEPLNISPDSSIASDNE